MTLRLRAATLSGDLVGKPGSRFALPTPALVVDLDAMGRNIATMAAHARAAGVALRPHAKTHKSVEIAKRQLAAGAIGFCCAKLGEAEALGAGGIQSLLITSPVVTPRAIARLIALNQRIDDLMVVTDSAANAEALGTAALASGKPLKLLVDIDPGLHRTGVPVGQAAYALARQIVAHRALHFAGMQCYAGQLMHMPNAAERRTKSHAILAELARARDELKKIGIDAKILTGGGTGTYDIDPDARLLSELQVGSYVFMDGQYNIVWDTERVNPPFESSLFVQTTVISANTDGLVTTDAGLKSFATEAGAPIIASGAPDGAAYFFFGDEQGGILFKDKAHRLNVGDVVSCVVPHCDPTVNLYEAYHVVRGDVLVDIWPVDARGMSQ